MLSIENCRERQRRLLLHMEVSGIDLVALGNPKTIYYFTGVPVDPGLPHAFALKAAGDALLITNRAPESHAADRIELYTGYTLDRVFNRATMNAEIAAVLGGFSRDARPAQTDFEFLNAGLAAALPAGTGNITPVLDEMRRVKDPDEIECMRRTAELAEAGYAAIKQRIEPGMTEVQAYSIIAEAMVSRAGASVEVRGDFACGTRAIGGGGPPTNRKLEPGDLYILDLFPTWHGYMCDLCRTFAVSRPTQLQQDTWGHVMEAHTIAQRIIRPGVPAREVYEAIRAHLDRFEPARGSFTHHAGHGLGMDGWEFPWLTPGSDQLVWQGEVIACEPALYSPRMGGGIRLEHNYLVGEEGVTPLDSFPMDLK